MVVFVWRVCLFEEILAWYGVDDCKGRVDLVFWAMLVSTTLHILMNISSKL